MRHAQPAPWIEDGYSWYYVTERRLNDRVRDTWRIHDRRLGMERRHKMGELLSAARRRILAEPGAKRAVADYLIYQATTDFWPDPLFVD